MKDVSVKAKAKLGKLLDDYLLERTINENDLDRKVSYLKKNYEFLSADDDKLVVEEKLNNYFFKQIRSIEFFLRSLDKKFYKLYFSIYKIYLIQEIITSILNNSLADNYKYFVNSPFFEGMELSPNYSLHDFVESIKDKHINRVLKPFLNENMDQDQLIFLSSNALIKLYYRDLLKMSEKFPSRDYKYINKYIAEEINLLNFEMLYRLKSFFEINNNEVFNYLIEGGYLFNADRLREISNLNKDEFIEYFSDSRYKNIFENEDLVYKRIQDRRWKNSRDEIINENCDILYVISAMNLLYLDIKNIISILEMDERYDYNQKRELLIGR
ncbi:V-type ATPase subunit [uncultured Anaerococcus sp.]|uniref:V0D/AC39 family V-type ATPase subunit n=1 Tax=uncultured Anaerococcus sp. TaxID=293428 RepID=UPI0025FE2508|nr:V-type ATPase subunit [uncultured Anaerococcus sp.]